MRNRASRRWLSASLCVCVWGAANAPGQLTSGAPVWVDGTVAASAEYGKPRAKGECTLVVLMQNTGKTEVVVRNNDALGGRVVERDYKEYRWGEENWYCFGSYEIQIVDDKGLVIGTTKKPFPWGGIIPSGEFAQCILPFEGPRVEGVFDIHLRCIDTPPSVSSVIGKRIIEMRNHEAPLSRLLGGCLRGVVFEKAKEKPGAERKEKEESRK